MRNWPGATTVDFLNRFEKFTLSSGIYYQHSIDVMTFVSRETGEFAIVDGQPLPVIERGPINLATDDRYGLEFNLNYSPTRKWRVNTDFNLFKLKRDGEFEDASVVG